MARGAVVEDTGCSMMMLAAAFLTAVLVSSGCPSKANASLENFSDMIRIGVRLASTLFSPEQNNAVSSIIERFGGSLAGNEKKSGPEKIVLFFMKLMGFNSTNIQDFALDGFIFLAHLMGQTMANKDQMNRRQRSSVFDFSPFQYVIEQPKVLNLLTQIEDPNIVEFILRESHRNLRGYPAEDVECIPLLICKMHPFIRGMQSSLKFFMWKNKNSQGTCYKNATKSDEYCEEQELWLNSDYERRIFFFVPSLDEVIRHGDQCDDRYPKCIY